MASRLLTPVHPGLLAAIVGTLVVTAGVASLTDRPAREPRAPSLDGHLGVSDCPARAVYDPLGPRALECWFYTGATGWRITKRVSAHHAFVVRIEVTDLDRAADIARLLVRQTRPAFGEVLVYASAVPDAPHAGHVPARRQRVTRIRWTEQDGFDTLTFERPATDE